MRFSLQAEGIGSTLPALDAICGQALLQPASMPFEQTIFDATEVTETILLAGPERGGRISTVLD